MSESNDAQQQAQDVDRATADSVVAVIQQQQFSGVILTEAAGRWTMMLSSPDGHHQAIMNGSTLDAVCKSMESWFAAENLEVLYMQQELPRDLLVVVAFNQSTNKVLLVPLISKEFVGVIL